MGIGMGNFRLTKCLSDCNSRSTGQEYVHGLKSPGVHPLRVLFRSIRGRELLPVGCQCITANVKSIKNLPHSFLSWLVKFMPVPHPKIYQIIAVFYSQWSLFVVLLLYSHDTHGLLSRHMISVVDSADSLPVEAQAAQGHRSTNQAHPMLQFQWRGPGGCSNVEMLSTGSGFFGPVTSLRA